MILRIFENLPFVEVTINYRGQDLSLKNVLIDTGSAGTVFAADRLLVIGLQYEDNDTVDRIRGVGGSEWVFIKKIDNLTLGTLYLTNFEIEVGAMNYGFDIDGIIGMNFLIEVGATIDLKHLEIF